ncbi:2-amino-4-hydroxy-6-hydroxymethyldihydropteridine diphosphokinase [Candidatus Sumerlaeota bacterium]|nr:2-amino-4-hydroxy-6-hydroxymethyldihydropteridine diphosphokinase [Candidatus Sumerlaeota bacterium]
MMPEQNAEELQVAYLGLGSNMGNKLLNVKQAIELINDLPSTNVIARAHLYRSDPWGFKQQEWFVNTVIAVLTRLTPLQLLKEIKAIEKQLGRKPASVRWGPRVIDIDILLFGQKVIDTPELKVPHQYLTERLFFLKPLMDIAPAVTLPTTAEPLSAYAEELSDQQYLVLLEE